MATHKVPYLVEQPGRGGVPRFFWKPGADLRAAGWTLRRIPEDWPKLAADVRALRLAAIGAAEALNEQVAAWRASGADRAPALPAERTLAALVPLYKASRFYQKNRPSTRRGYDQNIELVLSVLGAAVVAEFTPEDGEMFYQGMLASKPGRANHAVGMLRILFQFAVFKRWITANPIARPGLEGRPFTGRIWSRDATRFFVATADDLGGHSMGSAVVLDEWIGQREGDVIALKPDIYRNGELVVTQSKTGQRVPLPVDMIRAVGRRLREEQDRQRASNLRAATLIVSEATGRPYTSDHFRHKFAQVRQAAVERLLFLCFAGELGAATFGLVDGVFLGALARCAELARELAGCQFMHLRHTAVVRLYEAGASDAQVTAITGHRNPATIRRHYLVLTRELAAGGIALRLAREALAEDALEDFNYVGSRHHY